LENSSSLSAVAPNKDVQIVGAPAPSAIERPSGDDPLALGFMECFALRKNSSRKKEAGKAFVRWLLEEETQLYLVEASRIDRSRFKINMAYRHVPLYTPALQSPDFKAVCAAIPTYRVLADAVAAVRLTTPEHGQDFAKQEGLYKQAFYFTKRREVDEVMKDIPQLLEIIQAAQSGASKRGPQETDLDEY